MKKSISIILIMLCGQSILLAQEKLPTSQTVPSHKASKPVFCMSMRYDYLVGKPTEQTQENRNSQTLLFGIHYKLQPYLLCGFHVGINDVVYTNFPVGVNVGFQTQGILRLAGQLDASYLIPLNYDWKNINWETNHNSGGLALGTTLGVKKKITAHASVLMGISYRYSQLTTQIHYDWNGTNSQTRTDRFYLHRIGLSVQLFI